jgi:phosphate transport system protein
LPAIVQNPIGEGSIMTKHFHRELEKIKKMILSLGALVEKQVQSAKEAIDEKDEALAQQIIKKDFEIDEMEVEVEEECLKILALHQPVAVDLRFLIAVIKINNDLERIGDQAVNIAERVITLAKQDFDNFVFDYTTMVEKAQIMLKMSLDALVQMDVDLALKVCTLDDEVDEKKEQAYDSIKRAVKTDPDHIGYYINLLLISRHLERLADHSTNIAEEVIYMIEGDIVRHSNLE